ncbi:MAG TPA: hypothetical protein PL117_16815, partial [Accumulibacter sp.]|uniref:hypothetical protein n=1 Tax=Accumulibacter sp. TaxID=2053492 RepID=UPI002BD47CE3
MEVPRTSALNNSRQYQFILMPALFHLKDKTTRRWITTPARDFSLCRMSMKANAKPDLEIDPSGLWLEDDFFYLPRSNEAQSLGEQRFNHEEAAARGKAAIVLHAEGGRLPSSARRKRKRAGSDVKGSAAPGLRPPLTSPPPQTAKTSARSTRNDIDPSIKYATLVIAAWCFYSDKGVDQHGA